MLVIGLDQDETGGDGPNAQLLGSWKHRIIIVISIIPTEVVRIDEPSLDAQHRRLTQV